MGHQTELIRLKDGRPQGAGYGKPYSVEMINWMNRHPVYYGEPPQVPRRGREEPSGQDQAVASKPAERS